MNAELTPLQPIEGRKYQPDVLLETAKEIVGRNEKIMVINDVDLTVSSGGANGEDDPRKTKLHPVSAKALAKIEASGHLVGFVSNRPGGQVARMAKEAGIEHPTIIGTFGLELFKGDAKHPNQGIAYIDERFHHMAYPITDILSQLRSNVLAMTGQQDKAGKDVEVEIPTNDGPIILERKGLCDLFPEGLAAGYNFNLVDPGFRTGIIAPMQEQYENIMKQLMRENYTLAMLFGTTWGMTKNTNPPQLPGRYSLGFEPIIKQGKGYGVLRLLKEVQTNLQEGEKIGLITFAGDSDADAEGMSAARRAVMTHNQDPLHIPSYSWGIWVKPQHDQPQVKKQADIDVDGPDGYAELLVKLSNIVEKAAKTNN
jgi:hypothetical protein